MLEPYVGRSRSPNQGQRVVAGQRLMQAASDIFLGWQRADRPRRRPARLLRPPAPGLEGLRRRRGACAPSGLQLYGEICGWTLARAHARSGDRIAIAGYLGGSRRLRPGHRRSSPSAYADQNERDHQSLVDAVAAGRLTAERGL